jgi:HEAT repeat protein
VPPKRSSRQNFDAELAVLETLRNLPADEAAPALTHALDHRNNYLVAKAATLAQHHQLLALIPELTAAFSRFLEDAAKTDPQCWAKIAIAKALASFECQDSEFFLRGMRHVQLEPGWGGASDSAGPLRSTCALALVQCRELDSHRVLLHLVPLFADKVLSVRVDAARGVEQVGTDSAALVLRLRAELGSGEPELLGACYGGVLAVEGPSAIPWAAQFLPPEDDAAAEAALAIAETRTPEAFACLRGTFAEARDPWFRSALLAAIALTRQQEAIDWLIERIERDSSSEVRTAAHEALCRSAPSTAVTERLKELGRPCI